MRRLTSLIVVFAASVAFAQPAPDAAPAAGADVSVEKTAPAAATPPENAAQAYERKLGGLERRADDLKEKVFRAKTRLAILKESVLSSTIAGAEAKLVHRNEMGSSFKLEGLTFMLELGETFLIILLKSIVGLLLGLGLLSLLEFRKMGLGVLKGFLELPLFLEPLRFFLVVSMLLLGDIILQPGNLVLELIDLLLELPVLRIKSLLH